MLIASLYNPNIAWDEYSHLVALAEVEVVGMTAKMVGYDAEQASGVFTFSIKRQEFEDAAYRESLLAHNAYNQEIFQYVHSEAMEGRGVVISTTDCYRQTNYGEPIVALKSYILSPFVDEADVESVVAKVLEARAQVAENSICATASNGS